MQWGYIYIGGYRFKVIRPLPTISEQLIMIRSFLYMVHMTNIDGPHETLRGTLWLANHNKGENKVGYRVTPCCGQSTAQHLWKQQAIVCNHDPIILWGIQYNPVPSTLWVLHCGGVYDIMAATVRHECVSSLDIITQGTVNRIAYSPNVIGKRMNITRIARIKIRMCLVVARIYYTLCLLDLWRLFLYTILAKSYAISANQQ